MSHWELFKGIMWFPTLIWLTIILYFFTMIGIACKQDKI